MQSPLDGKPLWKIHLHVFFFYKKLGFLSWESQNGQKGKKLDKKPETLIFFGTTNFIFGTHDKATIFVRLTLCYKYKSSARIE